MLVSEKLIAVIGIFSVVVLCSQELIAKSRFSKKIKLFKIQRTKEQKFFTQLFLVLVFQTFVYSLLIKNEPKLLTTKCMPPDARNLLVSP